MQTQYVDNYAPSSVELSHGPLVEEGPGLTSDHDHTGPVRVVHVCV